MTVHCEYIGYTTIPRIDASADAMLLYLIFFEL